MNGGMLEYKCRRCGEVYSNTHVPDVLAALVGIESEGHTPKQWGAMETEHGLHGCKDGGIGVSDIIGGKPDDVKP